MMHDDVLSSMVTSLTRVFQPLISVLPVVATVDDAGALTGVLLDFPMGWRVLHVPCVNETDLAALTDAAAAVGVDVVWWLGDAADTPARRRWQAARNGYTIRLDRDRGRALGRVVLSEDTATAPLDLEVGVIEDIVASRWKHQALVRFFELWGAANRDRFVRALVGTHKLLGSFSGMIGFLNTQRTAPGRPCHPVRSTRTSCAGRKQGSRRRGRARGPGAPRHRQLEHEMSEQTYDALLARLAALDPHYERLFPAADERAIWDHAPR